MNFLKIEAGAKAAGTGGAFSAVADDASAVWWNPAGLAQQRIKQASFMHLSWFEDINYQFASYVHPLERYGTLGVGVSYLSVGGIDSYDNNGALLGSKVAASDIAAIFSYSRNIKKVEAGASLKYLSENLADESASSIALDAGAIYRVRTGYASGIVGRQLRIALGVQNVGQGVKYLEKEDPLPQNLRLGFAQDFFGESATLSLDFNQPNDDKYYVCTGIDYRITDWVSLRGGYRYKSERPDDDVQPGFTCGMGVGNDYISVDYAFVPYGDLGLTHRIGASYRFGRTQARSVAEAKIQKHLKYARKYYNNKDYINSYREFENVLTLDPVNLEAKDYIETIKKDINEIKVDKYIALAKKHQEEDRLLEAKRLLDDVLKFFPNDPEAQKHLSRVQAAIVDQKNARADSLFEQGMEFYNQGAYSDALTLFEKTLVINPAHAKAHEYINLSSTELSKINEAKRQETLEQNRAKAAGLLKKGNSLAKSGKYDKAKSTLEEARSLDRDNAEIADTLKQVNSEIADQHYKKGLQLYSSGDLKEAVSQLEEAVKLDPDNEKISENLIKIRGQFEESEKVKAENLNREGLKEYDSGNLKKAVELWEKAATLDPENTKIKNNLNRAKEELQKKK
ncbi:MAG: PorV/PorQ family protein [Endomicrobiales bacterium]|nr:PorV/PorQ family protein [Endomicrobiales bacterium]